MFITYEEIKLIDNGYKIYKNLQNYNYENLLTRKKVYIIIKIKNMKGYNNVRTFQMVYNKKKKS